MIHRIDYIAPSHTSDRKDSIMKLPHWIVALLLASCFFSSSSVLAQTPDISLKSCQYWKDKSEYYLDLRRSGGSAKQMEGWKKSRRKYNQAFRDNRCSDWRDELK